MQLQQQMELDSNTLKFNNNLKFIATKMYAPVSLKMEKYLAYKKQMQGIIKENETILKYYHWHIVAIQWYCRQLWRIKFYAAS